MNRPPPPASVTSRDAPYRSARLIRVVGGLLALMFGIGMEFVIASDHGNVEDATTGHTTNPVPVIAAGPGSERMANRVRSIADVTPAILELLAIE